MGRVRGITIQLERESGVFYAGEVVRGSVTFDIAGGTTSRGLQIHLRGKSHVHWHTGSGDNRRDYDASTEFQNQRVTLHGNYYKTGVIVNAGADANFDLIQGSGVIMIPCEGKDLNRMELIVRVMDQDWGKRDDLLGEFVVDAADVVRAGEKRTFPLTRNGKQERGNVELSAKVIPFAAVFQGEATGNGLSAFSQGRSHCLILRFHTATDLRKADWMSKNDVYIQVYRAPEGGNIIPYKKLPEPDKKILLPEGVNTYPFAFQLRADAPGSAELPVGDRAYVRYDLYANVAFASWRDPATKRVINVIPNRPLPMLKLLSPAKNETSPEPIFSCCCCGKQGMVTVLLEVDRSAYAPGETIGFRGNITNDTKKKLAVKLILTQHVKLMTYASSSNRTIDVVLGETVCSPGEMLDASSLAACSLPPVFPSFGGGVTGTPSRNFFPCLMWTYTLVLKAELADSICGSSVSAIVPLLVSAAPPYAEAVSKADPEPSLVVDKWAIFDFALQGPGRSDISPQITGAEDGGSICPAEGIGLVDTLVPGEVADQMFCNPSFQPVVNVFGTQATDNHSQDATPPPQTYPLAPITSNSGETKPVETGDSNAVENLLQELDRSFDKRKVVGDFVKYHPTEASVLSPDDFGQILSKILLTFEQTSVAGELAVGLQNSNMLTCAHVVAAMQSCKYCKFDTAKVMCPCVNDPRNSEMVLNELDYKFEREELTTYFPQVDESANLNEKSWQPSRRA